MKFKIGDRVYVKAFDDTGTVINIYKGVHAEYTIVIDPDHPEKHMPIEKYSLSKHPNPKEHTLTIHATESDCEHIKGSKPEPDWKDIWENN